MVRDLKNLRKIRLFVTSKQNKMRACDVRRITGADVVINGTLFNYDSWRPVCDVKAGGEVLSDDQYIYRGLGWYDGDSAFTVCKSTDMAGWDNFISCAFLINEGRALPLTVTPDVARASERTAIFHTRDGVTHLWCDKARMTPEQLTTALMRRKADWALMLDGGGSSQLSQEGDDYIYSGRKVQNYLCFWCDEEDPKAPEPPTSYYSPDVRAYSVKRDGHIKLSEHFRVREFRCNDGSDVVFVAPALVQVLENIRLHFGKEIIINSGYRTPPYNESVGGSPFSQHTYGTAADIHIKGVTPQAVADYARKIMPHHGGVGIYDTFTHVDVRRQRADWRG